MKKKKLLIFIPDGVGIKNYLLSDFIKFAAEGFEIVLAHNFHGSINDEINLESGRFIHINVPEYNESLKYKFLRESLCFARLNYNSKIKSNPSILVNWRRKFKNYPKRFFFKLVEKFGWYLSKDYNRIQRFTKYYHESLSNSTDINEYINLVKNLNPYIILTTHQRALHNIPLFAAAKKFNITTVSVIYSWDNMPKARIPFYSDYFFVWSEFMKKEFDQYYPEIDSNRIKITGTPQFEFYLKDTLLETKSDFFKKYNLDINKPVICYSGDDKLTSPYDPEFLRDLATENSKIENKIRPQIILRPSPADDGQRYNWVLKDFSDITFAPPVWQEHSDDDDWAVKFPKREDIKTLVNLVFHTDAVVNLGSTMAHDFAMFQKPAFYVNYKPVPSAQSPKDNHTKNWSVKTIYQYEHFKSMQGLNPVYWINKKEDFKNILKIIQTKTHSNREDQLLWRHKIIGEQHFKNSSRLLVDELVNLT